MFYKFNHFLISDVHTSNGKIERSLVKCSIPYFTHGLLACFFPLTEVHQTFTSSLPFLMFYSLFPSPISRIFASILISVLIQFLLSYMINFDVNFWNQSPSWQIALNWVYLISNHSFIKHWMMSYHDIDEHAKNYRSKSKMVKHSTDC